MGGCPLNERLPRMSTKVSLYNVNRPTKSNPRRKIWILRWTDNQGQRPGEVLGEVGKMTKREAEAVRQRKQSEFDCKIVPVDRPDRMTLEQFRDRVDELVYADLKARSKALNRSAFDWAIKAIGKQVQIESLGEQHRAKIHNAMVDADLAPGTQQKVLSYLRAAFNRAMKMKPPLVTHNPFAQFKVKGGNRAKDAVIRTHDEIAKLKAAATDPWWKAAICLWFTGLCEEEAFALKWSDVDLDAGTVTIRPAKATTFKVGDVEYPVLQWTAKTENRYRTVELGDDAVAALRQLEKVNDGSVYVFLSLERLRLLKAKAAATGKRGRSSLVNNALRDWKAFQERVLGENAEVCSIHDCRKTYCTLQSAAGMPIQDLAYQVGDTIEVVGRYYMKAKRETARKFRNTMDGPILRLAAG